jgi:hypothetical protein
MNFVAIFKPLGMRLRDGEQDRQIVKVSAGDRDAAAQMARTVAAAHGFGNYAITSIQEQKQ